MGVFSELTLEQKAAVVEWAIPFLVGLDAAGRVRRAGELCVELKVDAAGAVELDKLCRGSRTMDQVRVEVAERRHAELTEELVGGVEGGDVLLDEIDEPQSPEGRELALETVRRLAGVVDMRLLGARWAWDWKHRKTKYLRPGHEARGVVGAGECVLKNGLGVAWSHGAVLIVEEGSGAVVDLLPEARLQKSRNSRRPSQRGRDFSYVLWAPFQDQAGVVKRGRAGRPEVCRMRLNLDQMGMRLLAVLAAEMPSALEGATKADVGRALGVSKQAINYQVRKAEEAVRNAAYNTQKHQ